MDGLSSDPCHTMCCCGEIKNDKLSKTRYFGAGIVVLTVLALAIIAGTYLGISKAAALNPNVNVAILPKLVAAATWCAVPAGAGILFMIGSRVADEILSPRHRYHYKQN